MLSARSTKVPEQDGFFGCFAAVLQPRDDLPQLRMQGFGTEFPGIALGHALLEKSKRLGIGQRLRWA